jgi:ubiquinone biosynthesis protein UbiJ
VRNSIETATVEYIQEEARYLPTRVEIDHFMSDVDDLHSKVERLEVRLQIFKN